MGGSVSVPLRSFREEVLIPYPATLEVEPDATHCRSTLLAASIHSLKAHGHYERYAAALAPNDLATVTSAVAGMWIPIEVGVAHYRACDSLRLPLDEQLALGGKVVRALQKTFLGSVLKAAHSGIGLGALGGIQKFFGVYARSIKGGGARMVQIGPKDVRVNFVGQPLASVGYFRVAYRGFIHAGCEFFSRRVVVAELDAYRSATTIGYRIAWV
jgi:hypothetical protein